ncbi:hypothetical protein COO60DRAFT_491198 [Scenedesmus sp. NREL 46B-D3]|nr:hypothetical protein COO60DRAFT_491198 [Scenedesmus sp. NREL 46B-D3]
MLPTSCSVAYETAVAQQQQQRQHQASRVQQLPGQPRQRCTKEPAAEDEQQPALSAPAAARQHAPPLVLLPKQLWGRIMDPLNTEIFSIALPMLATLAADPIAGLVDTAYVGRLGANQLAGVGVALSVFNTTTKLLNVPLLSVTTSSVAAAAGRAAAEAKSAAAAANHGTTGGSTSSASLAAAAGLSSAISSSTLIAGVAGLVQALLLVGGGAWAAQLWGISASSPLWAPASDFLSIRALGAPVTVLLLVMQGVYRGLQDTRTPFYATIAANALNVVLGWAFIFGLGLGVKGAALATVTAQLLPLSWLFIRLARRYGVTFTDSSTLKSVGKLFAPTGYLVLRTAAITFTYAIATGLTARAGPAAAACHQVCFQLWLASSLMADSLAVACQTMLAKSLAARDTSTAQRVVQRCVSMASLLGCLLALLLWLGQRAIPAAFTADAAVLALVGSTLPFVVATQPVNALAFVWDGVLFGAGGFRYASVQMALCAVPAVVLMNLGPHALAGAAPAIKLQYVWLGLSLVMCCRALSIWAPYKLRLPPFPGPAGSGSTSKAAVAWLRSWPNPAACTPVGQHAQYRHGQCGCEHAQ